MLDKLERKFGKYAIRNFSYIMMIVYAIGSILGLLNSSIYTNFLSLNFEKIFQGQIWRLITFIFYPYIGGRDFTSILFGLLSMYLYYYIGNMLEYHWGAFKFNLYYISGIILNILASLMLYLIFGESISFGMKYIQNAIFLAFMSLNPDGEMRLYFVLPIKNKYLSYLYIAILAYEIISNLLTFTPGGIAIAIAILISILNYIIYTIGSKRKFSRKTIKKMKPKEFKMETEYPAHKCCVCGKTNITNKELEFRYCSKCNGLYEYCSDHLFKHEHIQK